MNYRANSNRSLYMQESSSPEEEILNIELKEEKIAESSVDEGKVKKKKAKKGASQKGQKGLISSLKEVLKSNITNNFNQKSVEDQKKILETIDKEQQKELFISLTPNEQRGLFGSLTPFIQKAVYQFLSIEERKPIFVFTDPEKQKTFFALLTPENRIFFFKDLDSSTQETICQLLDSEDLKDLFLSSAIEEQKKIFEFHTDDQKKEELIRALSSKKSKELFLLLEEKTQIEVLGYYKPEEQGRFFNSLKAGEQIEIFKEISDAQKVSLFSLIKPEQRNEFFIHLSLKDQDALLGLLPAEDQNIISNWVKKSPEEQVKDFKNLDSNRQVYLYISLPEEVRANLSDQLIDADHEILSVFKLEFSEEKILAFEALDNEEQNSLFTYLPWEEQIHFFDYLKPSSFKNSFFTSLSVGKQTKLLKHLDSEEQARFIETLPPDGQDLVRDWFSVSGQEQKRLFDSLDEEKQHSLLKLIKQLHKREKDLLISLFVKLDENAGILLFKDLQKKESKLSLLLFQKLNLQDKILLFTQLGNKERLSFFKGLTWEERDKLFKYLDLDAQANYFSERQNNTLAISKPLNVVDKAEESVGHLYKYRARLIQVLTFILGIGAMIFCLNYTLKFMKSSKSPEPIFTKIEGIKKLGEMHLVKQKYESVIPITDKKLSRKGKLKSENIEFLLIAPIEVTGYIDFGNLEVEVKKDSLLEIVVPEAYVSEAYLDFSKTEEYLAEGKFRIFGKYLERINHKQAYYDIAGGINAAKERVRLTAEKKHFILRETQNKAQIFLQNFGNTLGYRVDFVSAQEKELENESPDSEAAAPEKDSNGNLLKSAIKKVMP